MSAWTPGPWQVLHIEYGDDVTENLGIYQCSPQFHEVAYVARRYHGDRDKAAEQANARLIAAAPELYEALTALRDAVQASGKLEGREYVGIGIQVNAALAKATP